VQFFINGNFGNMTNPMTPYFLSIAYQLVIHSFSCGHPCCSLTFVGPENETRDKKAVADNIRTQTLWHANPNINDCYQPFKPSTLANSCPSDKLGTL